MEVEITGRRKTGKLDKIFGCTERLHACNGCYGGRHTWLNMLRKADLQCPLVKSCYDAFDFTLLKK